MTNWNILLESATDGQTIATVLELPAFQVTAGDRQTALDQIQQLLKQRLANAEVVPVSIPTAEDDSNPWLKFGGIFRSDADFEAIVRVIQRERQESVADNSDAFQELYADLAARADTDYLGPGRAEN
mgnify:CR=1 FL=1